MLAKGCYSAKIKSVKTFLKVFPRKFIPTKNTRLVYGIYSAEVPLTNSPSVLRRLILFLPCVVSGPQGSDLGLQLSQRLLYPRTRGDYHLRVCVGVCVCECVCGCVWVCMRESTI